MDAGAVPVAVATGIYTAEQLQAVADGVVVLDSLSDVDAVLRVMKLAA